jgi:hypothetical protein
MSCQTHSSDATVKSHAITSSSLVVPSASSAASTSSNRARTFSSSGCEVVPPSSSAWNPGGIGRSPPPRALTVFLIATA